MVVLVCAWPTVSLATLGGTPWAAMSDAAP